MTININDLCHIDCFYPGKNHRIYKLIKTLTDTNVSGWIYKEFYEVINNLDKLNLTFLNDRECKIIKHI